jgi:hypothetical protein
MEMPVMKNTTLFLIFIPFLLCACGAGTTPETAPTQQAATPIAVATVGDGGPTLAEQLAEIDQLFEEAMQANFAYNAPENMELNQTSTIRLLLNPSAGPDELATQVAEKGSNVVQGSLEITPRMKAELRAQDEDAMLVRPLHDSAEQLVSPEETTKWEWWVTARKEGQQRLTLIVYRLVKYEGHEYWREVTSYQSDIAITVTLAQRIQALDWSWIIGILATAILIPALWRWIDSRKDKGSGAANK